jgi:DNA repair exonuclease SbcCD nuclease subunit
MSVIILGDTHLGRSLSIGKVGIGATLNSRVADQLNLLDWTLDLAVEKCSSDIIITGDIFEEPRPNPQLITMFIAWLKKCQAYHIHVHIIMGNHDLYRSGNVFVSSLDIISEMDLEYVSVYKEINTIIIGSNAYTLVPFRDRKSFITDSNTDALAILQNTISYELASIPITYTKILIGHLAIEGSIPIGDEIDDLTNELFCPVTMFNGYDYVWMGHVHKPQVMKKSNPYVAHIGSMDISNFGETDHKKHVVIIEDSNYSIEYLPTRPLKKITISVPKETENTTEFILESLKNEVDFSKSIVKLEISLLDSELKSVNKSEIETYIMSQGAFNVANISESKKLNLIKRDINNNIDTKMDVVSAIKTYAHTYVDASKKDSFIQLAMDIYNEYRAEGKE